MTYKAKDIVVDRDGRRWQYNALYGTFSQTHTAVGNQVCGIEHFAPVQLERSHGPLKHTKRFEVTVERPGWHATVEGVHQSLTSNLYYGGGLSAGAKVTVKEIKDRRFVADRRVCKHSFIRSLSEPRRHSYGRRATDVKRDYWVRP